MSTTEERVKELIKGRTRAAEGDQQALTRSSEKVFATIAASLDTRPRIAAASQRRARVQVLRLVLVLSVARRVT